MLTRRRGHSRAGWRPRGPRLGWTWKQSLREVDQKTGASAQRFFVELVWKTSFCLSWSSTMRRTNNCRQLQGKRQRRRHCSPAQCLLVHGPALPGLVVDSVSLRSRQRLTRIVPHSWWYGMTAGTGWYRGEISGDGWWERKTEKQLASLGSSFLLCVSYRAVIGKSCKRQSLSLGRVCVGVCLLFSWCFGCVLFSQ